MNILWIAGGPQAAAGQQAEQQRIPAGSVRVHVKMLQRGVALKGAVLRAPAAEPSEEKQGGAESGILGAITSELPRGAGRWAGASGLCSSSALDKLR